MKQTTPTKNSPKIISAQKNYIFNNLGYKAEVEYGWHITNNIVISKIFGEFGGLLRSTLNTKTKKIKHLFIETA